MEPNPNRFISLKATVPQTDTLTVGKLPLFLGFKYTVRTEYVNCGLAKIMDSDLITLLLFAITIMLFYCQVIESDR